MLEGIEIPLTTASRDRDGITAEQKLADIEQKQAIHPRHFREMGYVSFRLPHVDGITVEFVEDETVMSINHFNIGDDDLVGRGIGSRLLVRAVEYGFKCHPKLTTLRHASANLALVNTVVNVVGEEYVSVFNRGEKYGFGTGQPLEAMFDDRPYEEDFPYLVDKVEAVLDRDAFALRQSEA